MWHVRNMLTVTLIIQTYIYTHLYIYIYIQVHRARLINGTEVVIKVQKPGVDSTLIADLNFLTILTKLIEYINPSLSRLSLSNIISDIRLSMFDELDFTKEIQNLNNFRDFLVVQSIVDVYAPLSYTEYSSKRVLTMEYLKGLYKYINCVYRYVCI